MMQVPILLVGVYAKIERAKEHVIDLETAVERFEKSRPYEVRRYTEKQSGDILFVLHVHAELPLRVNSVIGDCVQNLRASLDYLARQLVVANDREPTRQTAFPIYRSADEFESSGLGKVEGASDEAVAILKRLKPYRGGNDALWALHRLSIVDKHHEFVKAGVAHEDVTIDFSLGLRRAARESGFDWAEKIPSMPLGIRPANKQFPLVDGTVLYRISAGADLTEVDMNPQFTLQVTFGESEVVQGQPVLPTLYQLGRAVEETIELFHPIFG